MGADHRPAARAVFLDRDGVINPNVWNPATGCYESPLTEEDFSLAPGVPSALRSLQQAGYLLFLVSNQPNYAKGKASLETLTAIHKKLEGALSENSVRFAAFYYCLHHPEALVPELRGGCICRKPSPHFLFEAQRDFGVDLRRSWMVGDRATDIACGQAAGARTILIGEEYSGYEGPPPGSTAPDLPAAAKVILAEARPSPANSGEAVSMV